MSEEFEKFHLQHFGEEPRYSHYECPVYTYDGQMIEATWDAAIQSMQAKIDEQVTLTSYWKEKIINWKALADTWSFACMALKSELEDERIRLAACGVVALANTQESAKEQRKMLDKYKSASLQDVISAVDREMKYREELEALRGFVKNINYNRLNCDHLYLYENLLLFGLIDQDGNPTKLLAGEK
jgi:hypothetical protein